MAPGGAIDRGEDKGEDAIGGVGLVGGGPASAEEEVGQPHLTDSGQAGDDQVHGDQQDKGDSDEAADQKYGLHDPLHGLFGPEGAPAGDAGCSFFIVLNLFL